MTPEERYAEFIRVALAEVPPPSPETMALFRRLLPPVPEVPELPDSNSDKSIEAA